ncbi:MAG: hypothetical protein P4M00_14380 [Azospirillaceae bacterium]|nr:hypothetical protein [Azospirillaceae bacterium]
MRPTEVLADGGHAVVIGLLEFEGPIRQDIEGRFGSKVTRIIGLGELLSSTRDE